jgi:hypothetical protein
MEAHGIKIIFMKMKIHTATKSFSFLRRMKSLLVNQGEGKLGFSRKSMCFKNMPRV